MKIPTLKMTLMAVLGAVCLGLAGAQPAAACKNFVGNVCVDKVQKKTPTKRKKRATKRKPAAPAQPAEPARKAARTCADERITTTGKLYDGRSSYRYTVRNTCADSIVTFFQVDTCTKPSGYLGWNYKEGERRAFTLRAGQSKSINYWASPAYNDPQSSALRAFHYADEAKRTDRSKFPKSC